MIPGFSFARSSSGQVQRVRRIYPTHAINEIVVSNNAKYSLQGTTQGNGLTGADMPVRFSM